MFWGGCLWLTSLFTHSQAAFSSWSRKSSSRHPFGPDLVFRISQRLWSRYLHSPAHRTVPLPSCSGFLLRSSHILSHAPKTAFRPVMCLPVLLSAWTSRCIQLEGHQERPCCCPLSLHLSWSPDAFGSALD